MAAPSDARGAYLCWRRFNDGAVVFDSRHARTHLISPAAADVLELTKALGFVSSIDDLLDRLLDETRAARTFDALQPIDAREDLRAIVVELSRLGLIDSLVVEVVVAAGQDSTTDIAS